MRTDYIRIRGPGAPMPARQPGLVYKVIAGVLGTVALVGAFMVSVVLLAILAVAGTIGGAWLWWRTRELRKRMGELRRAREQAEGRVIDGEVTRDPN